MASSTQKVDLFCSYESSTVGTVVVNITNKLKLNEWNVIVDRFQTHYLSETKKDIRKANVFLCFFNREYRDSKICLEKILFANKLKKKIIIVMMQNIGIEKCSKIIQKIFANATICEAYKEISCYTRWSDDLFQELCMKIDAKLNSDNLQWSQINETEVAKSKYDVFCSYDTNDKQLVLNVCDEMNKRDVVVYLDRDRSYETLNVGENENYIQDSAIIVCFVTKQYFNSPNCQLELKFAKSKFKKCIYVMLENLTFDAQGRIGLYIPGSTKFNAFEEVNCQKYWSENLIEKLCALVYKTFCQIYTPTDMKKVDTGKELMNFSKQCCQVMLDSNGLREKSYKSRIDVKKEQNLNGKNAKLVCTIEGIYSNLDDQNKRITLYKQQLEGTIRQYQEVERYLSDQSNIYMSEIVLNLGINRDKAKNTLKELLSQRGSLIQKIQFLQNECLNLLDVETLNILEQYALMQINDPHVEIKYYETKKRNLANEHRRVFNSFKKTLEDMDVLNELSKKIKILEKYGVVVKEGPDSIAKLPNAHLEDTNEVDLEDL